MASKYWLKLYYETIHDWKFMSLPDASRLLFYDFLCIAGEHDQNGLLPPMSGISFILRKSPVEIEKAAQPLIDAGILEQTDDDAFFIVKFSKRQGPIPGNERVENFRKAKKREEYNEATYSNEVSNEPVTNRYIDKELDKELDVDVEKEEDAEADNDNPEKELEKAFYSATHIQINNGGSVKASQAYREMLKAGVLPEDIPIAVAEMAEKSYTIAGPWSIVKPAMNVMARRASKRNKSPAVDDHKRYISGEFGNVGVY